MTDLSNRLRGKIIPAVPVPFGRHGGIDRAAHQAYVRWMATQAVGGIAVWAHTGRGLWLTDEQRAEVLAGWRTGMPDAPIVCGVGVPRRARLPSAPSTRTEAVIAHTVRLAKNAKRGGAAAVMVHPPTALKGLRGIENRVQALHTAVAEVGLPVITFYLYDAAGGVSYSPDLVGRLLETPGVIGIKLATLDSVMTFQQLAQEVADVPGALLITGEDRFLGYSMMMGAHAALIGMAAACTEAMISLLGAWANRDLPRFVAQSELVDRFAAATFTEPMEGYVQRMLWALEVEGVLEPGARDRFAPHLPSNERERVSRAVRGLRGQ